jgi:hypothetical protein
MAMIARSPDWLSWQKTTCSCPAWLVLTPEDLTNTSVTVVIRSG